HAFVNTCVNFRLSVRCYFGRWKDFSYSIKLFVVAKTKRNQAMPLTPDQFSKCLADATRARIALLVAGEKELCVCELTCALDETQPKISRHLAQLRSGKVLADRR